MKEKSTLFKRDFTLVVIGQIISLFGNAILRFALPLYLLRETGSSALFGMVTACSFAPMVVLSMIGGVLADRVNKRNIMVGLDFCTAVLILIFYLSLGKLPTVPLFITVLMLLYGISGTYQPSVQASIPLLVSSEKLMAGNAVINQVNTLSGLLGPVIGGIMFGMWGIYPILILSIGCFSFSAVMEIFIHIPHEKRIRERGILTVVGNDLKESYQFVKTEKPIFFSVVFLISIFNLILSSVMIVGTPILITQVLKMSDTMYGFTQGALALGGLCSGILTAAIAEKLKLKSSYILLLVCAASVALMGISLMFHIPAILSYWVITLMSFTAMGASTLFVVQIYTMVQKQTPPQLVGKIMAALISIAMCGQPIGQAIYGVLFDIFESRTWIVLIVAAVAAFLIALYSKKIFSQLENSNE
ncbi:MFS transporter [Agathobaculum sp. NSJ-28]|uniref:MFS transporter n=2 Tax=Agathobaculum TaxID=2048137 RepID=A0A923LWK9_9FIRM|nr:MULTISPECIES: MFS transporter [Agathobaculum]MBC5725440.1 MFS transporter [Agathobaculum faecis]MCU6788765.1 MFS transporter [Agathobaculum ammoniilyticum]SCI92050.1 enterobactin exporter EntS [uncultured Butyricicoccus sp.]